MPLYINTWWEGAERTEPLSAVPRARTRGNEHKLNTRGTSVLCGRQSTDSGCSERLWGLLGDLICSCMDGYPALGVPAGAWVGPDGPRSLSEPQPHSDSEILCNSITHILPYLWMPSPEEHANLPEPFWKAQPSYAWMKKRFEKHNKVLWLQVLCQPSTNTFIQVNNRKH